MMQTKAAVLWEPGERGFEIEQLEMLEPRLRRGDGAVRGSGRLPQRSALRARAQCPTSPGGTGPRGAGVRRRRSDQT